MQVLKLIKLIKLLTLIIGSVIVYFINVTNFKFDDLSLRSQDSLDCGFTDHFNKFLTDKGYSSFKFNRSDIKCSSYGGKRSQTQVISKRPVIFLHGNSDVAFGRGTLDGYAQWQTGFRSLAAYLSASGYQKSQMYTTTWGNSTPDNASIVFHSKQTLLYLRKFVQVVLEYTQASEVVIIGHSMGVTLGRKIIKGGDAIDHVQGKYSLGPSIKDKVYSFIGIAGANIGLTACYGVSQDKYITCNKVDGFYPGLYASSTPSTYLNEINVQGGAEGKNIYTIWSKHDELIGQQCIVWGKVTCRIPNQNGQIVKTQKQWTHFALRDNTGQDIVPLI